MKVLVSRGDHQGPASPRSSEARNRLRALGGWLWRYSATRGGIVFVASLAAVGLSNLIFHVVISRLIGPASYGALGALLNVTAVVAVPMAAIQVTMAQIVARLEADDRDAPLRRVALVSTGVGLAVSGAWMVATPAVDRFLHLSTPLPTILLGLWLILVVPGAVLEGALIGQRRFAVVGAGQFVGSGATRLLVGSALASLGWGVDGAVLGTLAAAVVTLGVYAFALRSSIMRSGRLSLGRFEGVLSIGALGGAALLIALDAWLGRHFLDPVAAGEFAAAATAGNMTIFGPSAVTMMFFPRLAARRGTGPESRQALARMVGLVSLLGGVGALVMIVFSRLVIEVLFGPAFVGAAAVVGTLASADALIGVAIALIYYHVARSSRLALTGWLAVGLALLLVSAFHGSAEDVALSMLGAAAALVVGLGLASLAVVSSTLGEERASLSRTVILSEDPVVDVTVVVPARNVGAARLRLHLDRIAEVLERSGATFEIIPVSDGSSDGTEAAFTGLREVAFRPIVWSVNRGKGEALRAGLSRGRGRYLGFIDGDGDIPASVLGRFVEEVRRSAPEVLVGSKRHPESNVTYPLLRRLYSLGYQALARPLVGLGVRDTQTGVKLFRRDVVAEVLPRLVEQRYAFDIEFLSVARRLGFDHTVEVPVTIGERFPSTISLGAVWRMFQDTIATFWRLRVLKFYDPPLRDDRAEVLGDEGCVERLTNGGRLRILICNWRDLAHPCAGGAEVYTHRIASSWAQMGHEVTWFSAAVEGRPSGEVIDGVRVVRRGGRHSVYRRARQFYHRQGRGRFDLVVDEVNTRPFGAARWASDAHVVSLVHQVAKEVWFEELPLPVALLGRFFLEPRWLRSLRMVPVLTVSESSARSLEAAGIPGAVVVPEGIDAIEQPQVERETRPTIVFVGRLARNKRPDHVVEAFRRLVERIPDARLWVIGSGPMEEQLRRLQVPGVELLGHLDEDEKRSRLARAHCLVATSVREGWGLTVTEAAQVGTPAIAYDVDGLRDSVSASGGVLVRPRPDALSDTLVELLPRWANGELPSVNPGGVVPWALVARTLLDAAATQSVAWEVVAEFESHRLLRRAALKMSALCDRRIWATLGAVALVALAPLREMGLVAWSGRVAGVSLACFVVATLGVIGDALRWPLQPRPAARLSGNGSPVSPRSGHEPGTRRSWLVTAAVMVGVSAVLTTVLRAPVTGPLGPDRAVFSGGAVWLHQVALVVTGGRGLAARDLGSLLAAPIGLSASMLRVVGFRGAAVAWMWVVALLAGAGLSVAALVRAVGLGSKAARIGGVVYLLTPFIFSLQMLGIGGLAAMLAVPATLGWVVSKATSPRPSRLGMAALAGPALALTAMQPPLVVAFVAAVLGGVVLSWLIDGSGGFDRGVRVVVRSLPALGLGCLYWLVPVVLRLSSTRALSIFEHPDLGLLGARADLANAFWLNTFWQWYSRSLQPYALAFHHFPLVFLRFVVPVLGVAMAAVVGLRRRSRVDQVRLRLMGAAMATALVTIALAGEERSPAAMIYRILTAVPGGWVFDDMAIFLFVTAMALAVLVALGFEELLESSGPEGVEQPQVPQETAVATVTLAGKKASVAVESGHLLSALESVVVSAGEPDAWCSIEKDGSGRPRLLEGFQAKDRQ